MLANYHTHTVLCGHATGTVQEYAENALRAGIRVLGFSDHSPYPFPEGYVSSFRMGMDQLDGYVQMVLKLRERFQGRMEILLGLEAEYYPAYFPALLEALRPYPMDDLILGQHYLGNEMGNFYCGQETADAAKLRAYCRQCAEAMNTGRFTYLAHPDLFHFVGEEQTYRACMRTLCREAKSCHLPLEWNLLGWAEGRHYPNEVFWQVAAEEGCSVILGLDAHSPDAFLHPETERSARAALKKLGLTLLDQVTLRPVF